MIMSATAGGWVWVYELGDESGAREEVGIKDLTTGEQRVVARSLAASELREGRALAPRQIEQ